MNKLKVKNITPAHGKEYIFCWFVIYYEKLIHYVDKDQFLLSITEKAISYWLIKKNLTPT